MFVVNLAKCMIPQKLSKDGKNSKILKVKKTVKVSGRVEENEPIILFGGLFVLYLAAQF